MRSTPTCKIGPSTRPNLPASLILSATDLRHYLRFRRQGHLMLSPAELDRFPSAIEYADYLTWRKDKSAAQSFEVLIFNQCSKFDELSAHLKPVGAQRDELDATFGVATMCGHALHPGTPLASISSLKERVQRCPVCTIDAHLAYMELLTRVLNEAGGPTRPRNDPESKQEQVFQAWYFGKLDLVQTVYQFEEWTQHERQWHGSYRGVNIGDAKSAQDALNKYWNEALDLAEVEAVPARLRVEKEARVSFEEDTNFEPGRCQAYFCRKSPRFDGRYLGVVGEEDVESDSDVDMEVDLTEDDGMDSKSRSQTNLENLEDENFDFELNWKVDSGTIDREFGQFDSSSDTEVDTSEDSFKEQSSESDTEVEEMECKGDEDRDSFDEDEDEDADSEEDSSDDDEVIEYERYEEDGQVDSADFIVFAN